MQSLAIVVSLAVTGFALWAFYQSRKHITADDIQPRAFRSKRTVEEIVEGTDESVWLGLVDEIRTD